MDSDSFCNPTTVRFSPVQDATLGRMEDIFRVDRSEIIRRMVDYATERATLEDIRGVDDVETHSPNNTRFRLTLAQEDTLGRFDNKSAAIRRMVRFASENASDEELFAEEIATDRARDRGKEELEA